MTTRPIAVFFAKRPRAGVVKTRLCPPLSHEEAASLYEAFLLDVFDRFGRHRAPYAVGVAFDPPSERAYFESVAPRDATLFPQRGKSLAERMRNLFDDAFRQSWGPVAIVGTDLPTLPTANVDALLKPLADAAPSGNGAATMTLGLDRGGGYWGLGLRAPEARLFDGLATSTGGEARATLERAREAGLRVARAGIWGDVDDVDDVAALAREAKDPAVAAAIPRTAAALVRLGFLSV